MSNLHRLAWIDAQIRGKRYPNSRIIAEKFEISDRQAQRDIEYLKYSMGAPLEYCTGKNGYCYTDQTYMLPSQYISGEQKQALTYLAHQYRISGGGDVARLADLFSRLSGEETESNSSALNIPVFHIEAEEVEAYTMLVKAMDSRRKVKITYRNTKGETGVRVFHPYKVFNKDKVNYTAGFCELRNEVRVFRLSRIKELEMTEDAFKVSPFFNGDDYGPQIGFRFKEPYTAAVEFEKAFEPGAFKLRTAHETGNIYKIRFSSSDEMLTALLSQACAFTILSPGWLKERLKEKLNKIFHNNFTAT